MDSRTKERMSKGITEVIMEHLPDDLHKARHFIQSLRTVVQGYADEHAPAILLLVEREGEDVVSVHGINVDSLHALSMVQTVYGRMMEDETRNAPPTQERH